MLMNQASVPTGHTQTIPAASSPSPPPKLMRLNPSPRRNGGSPRRRRMRWLDQENNVKVKRIVGGGDGRMKG
ncbi:hypothetical protein L195_g001088, partial [Trifolium pratense]